jgi:hypothetical protein
MTNNNTPLTHAARLALFSAATPTITMPDRPTDRSRNGLRIPRSVPRRAIR